MIPELTCHEVTTFDDVLYDAFLDLFQTSFPLEEQVLVSGHNQELRARMRGEPTDERFLVALSGPDPVGMAQYRLARGNGAGVAWYLAVREGLRGGGIGARIYHEVVRLIREDNADASAVVYEVERPDRAHTPEQAHFAERRIRFYQRNGGLLLEGIRYVQSVGWQPPVEMHLMVHPLRGMGAEEAFRICADVFGDALKRTGDLCLKGLETPAGL